MAESIGTHRNMAFCLWELHRHHQRSMTQVALFQALYFKSTTLGVQSFQDLVTQGDAEFFSAMPVPEKRARLSAQRTRLEGLTIREKTEPSSQLLDLANAIYELGTMTCIPSRRCTKRNDEVSMGAKNKDRERQLLWLQLGGRVFPPDLQGAAWNGATKVYPAANKFQRSSCDASFSCRSRNFFMPQSNVASFFSISRA